MRMFGFGLVWLMVSGCQAGVASIGGDDASAKPDEDELSAIDSDRDGLSDGDEAAIGSDPHNPDTDGGGRLDGGEVRAGMNPADYADDQCWDSLTGANCWDDADSDGLHDDDELLIGSDPTAYDTDGGGLSDWMEVYFILDPVDSADDGTDLFTDTDGDWVSDALESNRYGTDPALADTDGGGLGDGEELMSYGTDPLDDSDDAWPLSDDDEDGLLNHQEGWYGTDPSVADTDGGGVNDYDEAMVDGTDALYGPDDGTDPYLDTDGDWVTDNVEIRAGTDPENPDTDGGGLGDGEEMYNFGTDPLDASDDVTYTLDTDADGIRDYQEVWYGTDPTLADTDGGGVNDYDELFDGTDPLRAADDGMDTSLDTDGDGLTDVTELFYGTDPTDADTDGGGLSDFLEVYQWGTDPLDANDDAAYTLDTDGDGLVDVVEGWYGTDPELADTDGGGVDDYTEVYVDWTNPLVASDDNV
jgi:hypothetical protein